MEWHGDRLNAFSEFLRSFIACLHSSSNQGFLGLELIEDCGIVLSAISKRVAEKSGLDPQIENHIYSNAGSKEF